MRIIATLIIGCLILSAGCGEPASLESPYDAARRWQEESSEAARREQTRRTRWSATLLADAKEALQPLIDEANEELLALDGVVYVDVQEYGRVVFFRKNSGWYASQSSGGSFDYRGDRLVVLDDPEDTLRSQWADSFALAQDFACQAEIGTARLTKVDLASPEPFEVAIEVKVTGTRRHVIAGEPNPGPEAPTGYVLWLTDARFGGGMYGSPGVAPFRIRPPRPPGEPHQPGQDELGDQAVSMLAEVTLSPIDHTGTAVLRYNTQEDKWTVVASTDSESIRMSSESLSWSHGISDEYRHHVFAPR